MKELTSERTAADYEQLEYLSRVGDFVLVGSKEVALLLGYCWDVVKQRRIPLPPTVPHLRRQRWRLGDVRKFMTEMEVQPGTVVVSKAAEKRRIGRPTKAEQVKRRQSEAK
jgi:hypothetical protein